MEFASGLPPRLPPPPAYEPRARWSDNSDHPARPARRHHCRPGSSKIPLRFGALAAGRSRAQQGRAPTGPDPAAYTTQIRNRSRGGLDVFLTSALSQALITAGCARASNPRLTPTRSFRKLDAGAGSGPRVESLRFETEIALGGLPPGQGSRGPRCGASRGHSCTAQGTAFTGRQPLAGSRGALSPCHLCVS